MAIQSLYDVVVVGGSYAGLSAAMALGRALRQVLIIDANQPCNRQTPHSHNLITQDGATPMQIAAIARAQVLAYPTVQLLTDTVTMITGTANEFEVTTSAGKTVQARKILFATGLRDQMPAIDGFAECWGISAIHCPYCHGYEYRSQSTGILVNGETALEFGKLIRNWTTELTVFTNGEPTFNTEQYRQLQSLGIDIETRKIKALVHTKGHMQHIVLADGIQYPLQALYARLPFEQHSSVPQSLGCAVTETGYLHVDDFKRTNVSGVYAAGDNSSKMRAVSGAIAAGGMAGAFINHDLISEGIFAANTSQDPFENQLDINRLLN